MSDLPTENLGAGRPPFAGAGADVRSRSLSEILEELALVTNAHQGDATAMRSAVSELTRALARLFEMIRADRADQTARITELELALQVANTRIAELEAGSAAGPAPSDFDALRDAAERLRRRTEELFQSAETPAQQAEREAAERADEQGGGLAPAASKELSDATEPTDAVGGDEAQVEEPVEVVDVPGDLAAAVPADEPEMSNRTELPIRPVQADEPLGPPGILRVFPGSALRGDLEDLEIENELIFDEDGPRRLVATAPIPGASSQRSREEDDDDSRPGERPPLTVKAPPEPLPVHPRPARKRRGLRRRRIDARKLQGVDPGTALRAMVAAVEQLWTAGHTLDLVIAMTDGGTLKVTGGDRVPLRVDAVKAGTAARSTVTATTDQVVPLFGRLELSAEQSTPLIHGSRRDADLLVGWIDRAQRLTAEPL